MKQTNGIFSPFLSPEWACYGQPHFPENGRIVTSCCQDVQHKWRKGCQLSFVFSISFSKPATFFHQYPVWARFCVLDNLILRPELLPPRLSSDPSDRLTDGSCFLITLPSPASNSLNKFCSLGSKLRLHLSSFRRTGANTYNLLKNKKNFINCSDKLANSAEFFHRAITSGPY